MEPIHNTSQRNPYLWKQAKARVGFRIHLRAFLIINGGLWLIWAFTAFVVRSTEHTGTFFPLAYFPDDRLGHWLTVALCQRIPQG
ncbi:hypothetical protein [Spirosoma horti]